MRRCARVKVIRVGQTRPWQRRCYSSATRYAWYLAASLPTTLMLMLLELTLIAFLLSYGCCWWRWLWLLIWPDRLLWLLHLLLLLIRVSGRRRRVAALLGLFRVLVGSRSYLSLWLSLCGSLRGWTILAMIRDETLLLTVAIRLIMHW